MYLLKTKIFGSFKIPNYLFINIKIYFISLTYNFCVNNNHYYPLLHNRYFIVNNKFSFLNPNNLIKQFPLIITKIMALFFKFIIYLFLIKNFRTIKIVTVNFFIRFYLFNQLVLSF